MQRPQVPIPRQPRPAADRDRQLPGVSAPPGRADPAHVICTLGNFSTKLLRGDPTGITRLHGQPEVLTLGRRAVRLYPIFHPAAALYTPRMLETLREDFTRLPELLALGAPEQPDPAEMPERWSREAASEAGANRAAEEQGSGDRPARACSRHCLGRRFPPERGDLGGNRRTFRARAKANRDGCR